MHHDLWDADIAIAPLLYDAEVDGQPRKALAALRADGDFFLLDHETGEPIHPVEERPVTQDPFNFTSPIQPYPVGADSIVWECTSWQDQVSPPWGLDCSGLVPPFLDRHRRTQRADSHGAAWTGLRRVLDPASRKRHPGGDRQSHQQDRVAKRGSTGATDGRLTKRRSV